MDLALGFERFIPREPMKVVLYECQALETWMFGGKRRTRELSEILKPGCKTRGCSKTSQEIPLESATHCDSMSLWRPFVNSITILIAGRYSAGA